MPNLTRRFLIAAGLAPWRIASAAPGTRPAPELEFTSFQGPAQKLSQHRGKPVVVYLFNPG